MSKTTPSSWRHPAIALILPLALLALGVWQLTRVTGAIETYEARTTRIHASIARLGAEAARNPQMTVRFTGDPELYPAADAIKRMQDGASELDHDVLIEQARTVAAWAAIAGGAVALLAALLCLTLTALGARNGRRSRDHLVRAFRQVVRALPPFLGTVTVATAIALVGAVLFEAGGVWFMDSISTGDIKLIIAGLLVAVGSVIFAVTSVLQLRRALDAFTPHPMKVLGRAIPRDEAPALWSFVTDLAARQGATPPDNIVLGLIQGFYVTSSRMRVAPEDRVLSGRSLYLPAGVLPLLSRAEITAVIAHELAHFTGEDTEYSLHFLPLFHSIERSMAAVTERRRATTWIEAITQPAGLLAGHVLETFDHVVSHWSRLREFEADRASLRAGSQRGAATALIRTALGSSIVSGTLDDLYDRPAGARADVVGEILSRAGAVGFADPSRHLEDRQPHPTDSHPPTRQRIEALGVPLDATLLAEASRPVQQADAAFADSLFPDWPALRRRLGDDILAVARQHDRKRQAQLEQAATAIVEDIPIHERGGRLVTLGIGIPGVMLIVSALVLAWVPFGSVWVSGNDVWVAVAAAGVIGLLGASFIVLAAYRHKRVRSGPFLVVGPQGFHCRGIDGAIPWSAVQNIQVMVGRAYITTFTFVSGASLPAQLSHRWTVKLDRRHNQLRLKGYMPAGLKPQAYLDLLNSALRAYRAQKLLREREAAAKPA